MSLDYLKDQNKVSKKRSPMLRMLLMGFGVVISIFAAYFVGTSGGSSENSDDGRAEVQVKDLNDLKYSMQKLRATSASNEDFQSEFSTEDQEANRAQAKIKMIKQNAPSSLYHQAAHFDATSNGGGSQKKDNQTFNNDGSSYAKFGNQAYTPAVIKATRGANPKSTVMSGEFIHANLETAINSDLPGMVRAIVSRPVYSFVGHRVLIPRGSRLIGQYSSQTRRGINRVFVIWNRVILPNGNSALISSPSSDGLGQAGQGADEYNTHFMKRFGMAGLLSVIGAGTANIGVDPSEQLNSRSAYRMAIGNSFNSAAQSSLSEANNIKPTIKVYQGSTINVFVAHDIDFSGVL